MHPNNNPFLTGSSYIKMIFSYEGNFQVDSKTNNDTEEYTLIKVYSSKGEYVLLSTKTYNQLSQTTGLHLYRVIKSNDYIRYEHKDIQLTKDKRGRTCIKNKTTGKETYVPLLDIHGLYLYLNRDGEYHKVFKKRPTTRHDDIMTYNYNHMINLITHSDLIKDMYSVRQGQRKRSVPYDINSTIVWDLELDNTNPGYVLDDFVTNDTNRDINCSEVILVLSRQYMMDKVGNNKDFINQVSIALTGLSVDQLDNYYKDTYKSNGCPTSLYYRIVRLLMHERKKLEKLTYELSMLDYKKNNGSLTDYYYKEMNEHHMKLKRASQVSVLRLENTIRNIGDKNYVKNYIGLEKNKGMVL